MKWILKKRLLRKDRQDIWNNVYQAEWRVSNEILLIIEIICDNKMNGSPTRSLWKKIKDLLLNFSQESMLACMTYCIELQLDSPNPTPVMYILQTERKWKVGTSDGIL